VPDERTATASDLFSAVQSNSTVEAIQRALKVVRDGCDGARAQDGQGFSMADVYLGHTLAELDPAQWTKRQAERGWKLVLKYRRQVEAAGIDIVEIPYPDDSVPWAADPEAMRRISIDNSGEAIRLRFPYDQVLVAAVKTMPGRHWCQGSQQWIVPRTDELLLGLEAFADTFGFTIEPEVAAWVEIAKERARVQPTEAWTLGDEAILPRQVTLDRDGVAQIRFPFDERVVGAVRQIPGARWDKIVHAWKVKLIPTAVKALEEVAEVYQFDVAPEVHEAIARALVEREEAKAASRATGDEFEVAGLGGTLRPFQKAGVAYAARAKRCFIADEMGLGKTVEALATLEHLHAFPALVVCPASLKLNWIRETIKWLPARSIKTIAGTKRAASYEADLLVINYDILSSHKDALMKAGLRAVVFDESHYLKNGRAVRSKAARTIAAHAEVRLALTGTPVLNRPVELISQLGILGRLDEFGGFWPFAKRYCDAYKGEWGWDLSGASNLSELNQRMREACYIRRNKADVLSELPAKQRSMVEVEIDNLDEYREAEADVVAWLRDNASEEKAARATKAEQMVKIEVLKRLSADGKLAAVGGWIEDFLETSEKLVVFAHHIDVQKALLAKFRDAAHVLGEDDAAARQASVDRFQRDDRCRLIVCSLKAAGVGLTLTAASNVVFVELGWTPADHDQAEDRCHRIGQTDSVNCWYLVGRGTIDERIAKLIDEKRAVVDAATEGGEADGTSILGGLVSSMVGELSDNLL
jgi:hypothetical protein